MKKLSLKTAKDVLSRKEMRAINGGSGGWGTCDHQCYNDSDCDCIRDCYGYSTGMGAQHCGMFICRYGNTMQRRCSC